MPIRKCFDDFGRTDLQKNFEDKVSSGQSEHDAARDILLDEHKNLHAQTNVLRNEINKGIKNKKEQLPVSEYKEQEFTKTEKPIKENQSSPVTDDNGDVTSIKNETTRLRREQFGLEKEIPAAKKEFGETWDEAKLKIENGYDPQDLIDELHKKPRPLNDVENAILLHHQNSKEIDLLDTNKGINEASEKGDEQTVQELKTHKARLSDELQRIYDVDKAVGRENARGLSSRQMMVDRKYSLVNMIAEKRATANDGKPLSEEQQAEVEKLHQKIQETKKEYEDYVKEAEAEIKGLQEKILGKGVKDKKSAATKLRELAAKVEKSNIGKANLPKGTQLQGTSVDINKMVAQGMRLIADGLEKGEEVLDLVKKAVKKLKEDNPDIDELLLTKKINKAVIDANIVNTDKPETKKQIKYFSGLLQGSELDRKALSLKADYERAKANADISLKKDEQKKRSVPAKVQDIFIKWQRGFKLSNPLTIGKLMMAGFSRLTTTPLEDLVGGAYSLVMPKLAKGAIGEGGGLNVNETAKAYKNGLIEGMKDAAMIMKSKSSHGKSNLDTVFGKLGELPPEAIDFFGQLHSATKAPFKRFAFERSLSKRLRRNIANGVDVSDPLVQTEILTGAYKDANRAIFMQDNKVATGWQNMVKYLETHGNKGTATALQWMLPFVKIPTNIAAEIGTNVAGVPIAAGKLLHAGFTKGTENLTPDEKDIIFRSLKKGTLGLGALALGYLNPQNFGGYYQQGEKRGEDDAQAMGLKLFGVRIPAWFVESPIFQAMQIGATIRRVKDTMVKGEPKGMTEGAWAGLLGLADRVPMIDQPIRMSQVFTNAKDRQYYLGELAKSTVDPALVTYLANATDPADKGSFLKKALNPENKRRPQTILEHIKSGIPGLRETVGEKQNPFTEEDKKDSVFKYFKEKGLELPNTVHTSEKITDRVKGTKIPLSNFSQDIQDKYDDTHKDILRHYLKNAETRGVYLQEFLDENDNPKNEVSFDAPATGKYKRVQLDDLSKDDLVKVLHLAQSNATTDTKEKLKKLFKQ